MTHKSEDYKISAVKYYLKNKDNIRKTCKIFDCKKSTLQRWIDYIYPVNIGNPHEITVKELATIIIELTKSTSRIVFQPLPSDDPTNRKPDITLAKKILNWEPTYDLETGLLHLFTFQTPILTAKKNKKV
jgi:nucleoside-diphosphate-sugar epimerase